MRLPNWFLFFSVALLSISSLQADGSGDLSIDPEIQDKISLSSTSTDPPITTTLTPDPTLPPSTSIKTADPTTIQPVETTFIPAESTSKESTSISTTTIINSTVDLLSTTTEKGVIPPANSEMAYSSNFTLKNKEKSLSTPVVIGLFVSSTVLVIGCIAGIIYYVINSKKKKKNKTSNSISKTSNTSTSRLESSNGKEGRRKEYDNPVRRKAEELQAQGHKNVIYDPALNMVVSLDSQREEAK